VPPQIYEYQRGPFYISTDPRLLDIDVIHSFLTHSYWSPGVPRALVATAIQHSLCFGLYDQGRQIGLARVVTDYASFAYLGDVFVLKSYRGQGLGVWLVQCVTQCPALAEIRTFLLATRDAHGLYHKVGFEAMPNPERWMVIYAPRPWRNQELVVEDEASQSS
jgi:GNAT superfamily N-acetyltransferase